LMREKPDFDLYLMMTIERVFILQGMTDPKGVLDALYAIHKEGAPWFRQSGLYAAFHILRRLDHADDEMLDLYAEMTDEFVEQNKATMETRAIKKTKVEKYSFSPHLAWPEVVFEKHRPRSGRKFISRYLEESLQDSNTELRDLCTTAAVLLSLVYQHHDRAAGSLLPLVGNKDEKIADLLVQTLANIRFHDETSVDRFLDQLRDQTLTGKVRGCSPVIGREYYPTWIDEFVIQGMISSPRMRSEFGRAFENAATARSARQSIHRVVAWVLGLIAEEGGAYQGNNCKLG